MGDANAAFRGSYGQNECDRVAMVVIAQAANGSYGSNAVAPLPAAMGGKRTFRVPAVFVG